MANSDRIPLSNNKPGGIDCAGFGVDPRFSNAQNSIGIQEALDAAGANGGGLVTSSWSESVYLDRAVSIPSNVTWEIQAGATLDTTLLSVNAITATSKSNIRLCGDGKIVCAAASVPSFTGCMPLSVDIRIEDATGNPLYALVSGANTAPNIPSFGAVSPRIPILNGANAGDDSGWLPISPSPERFVYQLDSGSTPTTFSVDISADGISSLGQAFTGSWSSSTVAEITFPIMYSNPLARFFRWNVLSGGPLSVSRGA